MRALLIFSIFIFAQLSYAQTISNQAYLGKLSKSLRGIPISFQERQELAQAEITNSVDIYIDQKIHEYMKGGLFQIKMKTLVDEHFRLRANQNPFNVSQGYDNSYTLKTAYDFLVENIIGENKSWDNFLVAKKYTYEFFKNPNGLDGDQAFYGTLLNWQASYDLVSELNGGGSGRPISETVEFDPQDMRIAGVITTSRFLDRYQNTALNKNRRRAAAIFRSFLCDDMVAAIPAKTNDSENKDFDTLLPAAPNAQAGGKSEDQLRRELRKSDPHGTLPGCMACHSKLDPMGRTLGLSPFGLSDQLSAGALVYKTSGHSVNIPVRGVGELAEKITQQKEYLDCQVNLFWKWYVGQDVPKTEVRHNELVAAFEKGGRRPWDFVAYLVQTSEFKKPPVLLTESQILARNAAKILKRCYDCHKDQYENLEMQEWDLTDLPYGTTPQARAYAINQLSSALDIKGNGAKKYMPPKDSLWQLSTDQYDTLKKWIQEGAPDYSGQRQIP